jgi:hypothetical protein
MRTRLRRLERRKLTQKEPVFFTLVDGSYYHGFISSYETSSAERAEPEDVDRLSYDDSKIIIVIDLDTWRETIDSLDVSGVQ